MSHITISTRDLSIYQRNTLVLSKVNIEISAGELVYLIGKTGTGKSSLLRTLYADIPVKEGEAVVATCALHTLRTKQIPFLRRKLGIVFQDFQLLQDRSVYDNLRFVLEATQWKDKLAIKKRIEEVLEAVKMQTKAYKMPFQLSGGEQQRLAIARALLNNPEVILADEPTGNLDPETSEEILRLLVDISKSGCTVLVASHDIYMISKYPSRVLVCEGGKVFDDRV